MAVDLSNINLDKISAINRNPDESIYDYKKRIKREYLGQVIHEIKGTHNVEEKLSMLLTVVEIVVKDCL